jgi:hypothetical protein
MHIKSNIINWQEWMITNCLKKILRTNPRSQLGRGRQISRWNDGIEEEARKLGCRNWLADVQDKGPWRHLLEEAKVHSGL